MILSLNLRYDGPTRPARSPLVGYYFEAVIPMAKTPPHATGLHSARASETRSPISCCAARILSAEARRRPRTSLSFDSYALLHLAAQVLYEGGLDGLLRSFSKPFIGTAPPDCRFSLFSPSPATSSPLAVWAEEIGSAFIAWLTSPPRCLFIIKRLPAKVTGK
jgi:hypothetical protein